ncbi:LEAF RUST 10 DISEASE-RESISTANCE LOCUS RECEPTOR-LIKE PROTEIN KINASE-like 2.7 [Cardamine amara subsp. amara]|uniref:LEAF RUST 10 DISEASE-RESISTANCE LOCUS RECEPTOR-LIKE PROTEIN KINASE-like 2.7 n=1 Tax=Cardamine amara subsp. amara TaxID=228776 RepID=A0ABD1B2B2_CARAN
MSFTSSTVNRLAAAIRKNCCTLSGFLAEKDAATLTFKLDCIGGFAELNISSVKFRVLEANYETRKIKLARSNFINNLCPSYPPDAPFNENVLPFARNTELLTIYYDCERDFLPPFPTFFGQLICPDNRIDRKTSYYVTKNLSSSLLQPISDRLNELRGNCDRSVSIPANGEALITLQRTPSADNL